MRATLLGHACWLIEAGGKRILTDPVFTDPFEEGTVTACPAREIRPDALPPLDAITISHRHLDHFHLPTLASLPKELPVYCPNDPLMRRALGELGFTTLHTLSPLSTHTLGTATLIAVPGVSDTFEEYGLAICDDTGVLLDQVDTPLTGATIDRLRAILGRPIDVHIAMYACQDFTFFEGRRRDLAEVHATNLSAAARLGAGVVVPGAAGFRFVDGLDWLNPHLFPISAERFMADLARLNTGQTPMSLHPGDQLEITADAVRCHRQAVDYVRLSEDDTHRIAYDPTAAVPALTDDNEHNYPPDFLRRFAAGFIGQVIPALLSQLSDDPVIIAYRQHRVPYRLEVVFPDGEVQRWTVRFDLPQPRLESGDSVEPLVRKRIAASALADVCGGRRGCFWMRTRALRSSTVFAMAPAAGGLMVEEVDLRDLLTHLILISKVAREGEARALRQFYGLTLS
jgi:UDP-MurNAc hydroxylase